MGGEFCALIRPSREGAHAILDAPMIALSERGDGLTGGCSYGSLTIPDEATTPTAALALADRRLDAHKHARAHNADVLFRALDDAQLSRSSGAPARCCRDSRR